MSHALVLVLALLLDAAMGEPEWLWSRLPHPAVAMGHVVNWLDRQLNSGANRRQKGAIATLALLCCAIALGLLLVQLGPWVEIIIAAMLLAQRSLADHVRAVADALRLSVGDGRRVVARIVSRDCREMSTPQVARAAIESASENLSDGIIAPAFWFLIAGLPGLLVYKFINTADSMIGYRTDKYRDFGWAAARTDDVLNLIPARLTGLMIALLSGHLGQWGDITKDAQRHRSPNAGWPEAAMARALGIALAGPRSYDGQMQQLAWVNGNANQHIGAAEIDRAVTMLWRVWRLTLGLVLIIGLAAHLPLT
ncbi:MAG: cobalamin biosynthesis protein [Rhodobacteraceae bacterium]|nr:cobalamin biosynthesis protein [Paracoccaceae bacterium]